MNIKMDTRNSYIREKDLELWKTFLVFVRNAVNTFVTEFPNVFIRIRLVFLPTFVIIFGKVCFPVWNLLFCKVFHRQQKGLELGFQ
jgi:hypothetical protein